MEILYFGFYTFFMWWALSLASKSHTIQLDKTTLIGVNLLAIALVALAGLCLLGAI